MKVPHHGKWLQIIRFLRRRGWNIGENGYYKSNYKCLSKYHKIGFKKDCVCLMEIGGAFIRVEFGNTKNLWHDMPQNFWDSPTDSRYTPLSYLEEVRVKLEVKKLMNFCSKYGHELIVEDKDLSPEQRIIQKLKVNTHIHGKVTCLNDIKAAIKEDSYDYLHNSNDKNKKKIICGQLKYFYDYNRRLSCGIVWHNINNMWWVICGGKLRNVAAFDLFDYEHGAPRRQPATPRKIEQLLKEYEKKRDYQKCLNIQKYAGRVIEAA